LLKEIVEAFLDECPRLLENLRESIQQGDPAVLQRAAHTLKGSMRYLGAAEAYDRAYELECMGRDGRLSGASQQLQRLEEEIDRLKPVLTSFAKTGQFEDPTGSA
jgi:HPt (histidine-containing phosphotransfer) domain-containing protein